MVMFSYQRVTLTGPSVALRAQQLHIRARPDSTTLLMKYSNVHGLNSNLWSLRSAAHVYHCLGQYFQFSIGCPCIFPIGTFFTGIGEFQQNISITINSPFTVLKPPFSYGFIMFYSRITIKSPGKITIRQQNSPIINLPSPKIWSFGDGSSCLIMDRHWYFGKKTLHLPK